MNFSDEGFELVWIECMSISFPLKSKDLENVITKEATSRQLDSQSAHIIHVNFLPFNFVRNAAEMSCIGRWKPNELGDHSLYCHLSPGPRSACIINYFCDQ